MNIAHHQQEVEHDLNGVFLSELLKNKIRH